MSLHGSQTKIHVIENWSFANAAARIANGTYATADLGKVGYQQDNFTYWRLIQVANPGATATPGWMPITSGMLNVVAKTGNYAFTLADINTIFIYRGGSPGTFSIPDNSSVPFPPATMILIMVANGAGLLTIQPNTDTLRRGDGTAGTGNRTVSPNCCGCLIKTESATEWYMVGNIG